MTEPIPAGIPPMEEDHAIFDQIVELIASQTGDRPDRIQPTTRLGQDLGIAGDDGVELMVEFQSRFQVDLTGFDSVRYFGREGMWPHEMLLLIWYLLLWQFGYRTSDATPPLTVQVLVDTVKRGRWLPIAEVED